MTLRKHGRRVAVRGLRKRKPPRAPGPLTARQVKGWQPTGWTPELNVPCGKVCHPTREQALVGTFSRRAYRCPDCNGQWHSTSFQAF